MLPLLRSIAHRPSVPLLVIFLGIACVAGGCSGSFYTTPQIRQQARTLNKEIGEYRDDQAKRVDRINAQYRQTFAKLTSDLRELFKLQLSQQREMDAQKIADDMIANWPTATLRAHFRESFAAAIVQQRQRIQETDEAIAKARNDYTQNFREAKLQLSELDQIRSDLTAISEDVSGLRKVADLIRIAGQAFEKSREEAAKKSGAKT